MAVQNGSFNDTYTANNQLFVHAYDAAGNLLADGLGNVLTWDSQDRLLTVGGATYVYDALPPAPYFAVTVKLYVAE